jgi:hypothetical protein
MISTVCSTSLKAKISSFIFKSFIATLFLVVFCFIPLKAQRDTGRVAVHSPHKASVLSALLPGAGQYYNKKYWKIPIIYAGFAGLGYLTVSNHDSYATYRDAFKNRADGDESTTDPYVGIYSDNDLITLKDFYRRNRDLSLIGVGVLYILNIIDATVDAHLFRFDVSDNLSLEWTPVPEFASGNSPTSLSISIKLQARR